MERHALIHLKTKAQADALIAMVERRVGKRTKRKASPKKALRPIALALPRMRVASAHEFTDEEADGLWALTRLGDASYSTRAAA